MDYQLSEHAYTAFSRFLHEKLGIFLGENKQYLVRSRLSALARKQQYEDFNQFVQHVISIKDRVLTDKCLELMTTNETFWFRDEYPYQLLKNEILPYLYKQKRNTQQNRLRIWSSACSSGQEPYSMAMVIDQFKKQYPDAFAGGIEIAATDYSDKMINMASAGVYDELALNRGLPRNLRTTYFLPTNTKESQIDPNLQKIIKFRRFNLLNDYAGFGQFDVIFCRNVLIYFDGNQKNQVLKKLAACLPSSGTLFLGAAESISGAESLFKMTSKGTGLYYSKL